MYLFPKTKSKLQRVLETILLVVLVLAIWGGFVYYISTAK
jgi:hypothetical protein